MNFSRQALLGIGMIIGGSVMLYAMVQQINEDKNSVPTTVVMDQPNEEQLTPQPLTTDIDTEKRILAQKQKERAARVAEQERRAQQFTTEQQNAEAQALAKSRAENQQYLENSAPAKSEGQTDETSDTENTVATPLTLSTTADNDAKTAQQIAADNKRLEERRQQERVKQQAEAAAKKAALEKQEQAALQNRQAAQQASTAKNDSKTPTGGYQVKQGDGLIKLARQHNMPVELLAKANNLPTSASLQLGQTLTIPSRSQVQRLEREAAAAVQAREDKRKKEEALAKKSADAKREAQQKLSEARKEVEDTDAKGSFGVQVALANNQNNADEMVKKFQAAGYQVKTSTTSRGVRVIVGPERGKVAALALKDKINSDPKVNTTSAWVLYWR